MHSGEKLYRLYKDSSSFTAVSYTHLDTYIQGLVNDVKKYVSDAGIKAEIYGRAKHFFSIYKKMAVSYTHLRTIAVLGDMGELGSDEKKLHHEVGEAVGELSLIHI